MDSSCFPSQGEKCVGAGAGSSRLDGRSGADGSFPCGRSPSTRFCQECQGFPYLRFARDLHRDGQLEKGETPFLSSDNPLMARNECITPSLIMSSRSSRVIRSALS